MPAATKQDIYHWWVAGKRNHASHMLIVCDTFDHEDYPVYVKQLDESDVILGSDDNEWTIDKAIAKYSTNMQHIHEIYDLSMDMTTQLASARAWNI